MATARAALPPGHSGIGTTLSANALAITAMRAMLEQVMTRQAYRHMDALAAQLVKGLGEVITRRGLPWHVVNVGARVELVCAGYPSRNGTEARAAMDHELESLLHLMLVNRGSLIAPFHNMMLVSPATLPLQVERLIASFDAAAGLLCAAS
jgi:glutamate-1-semialdehyde 2,1-aminomutase